MYAPSKFAHIVFDKRLIPSEAWMRLGGAIYATKLPMLASLWSIGCVQRATLRPDNQASAVFEDLIHQAYRLVLVRQDFLVDHQPIKVTAQ
jgi:hypothetical protein